MSWAAESTAAIIELASVFGHTATWHPAQGGTAALAQPVLFESASASLDLKAGGNDGINTSFDYTNYQITAPSARFPGLKLAVDSGQEEQVLVEENGEPLGRFHVRDVRYVNGGQLITARLSEIKSHAEPNRGRAHPALDHFFTG